MRRPNLFIVGAPKSGTTSIASWLAAHPSVFMCRPKEPHYFNTDFGNPRRPRSLSCYEALFAAASGAHPVVGEASTRYLRSQVAIPRILDYADEPRFLVAIRNPVEIAPSLHAQYLTGGIETERSFERAWQMQAARRRGERVPALCPDAKDLIYDDACRLGFQLERMFRWVERDRVLVVVLDDLRDDPRREYRRILRFLGVDDDGRRDFGVHNRRRAPRSFLVARALRVLWDLKGRLGYTGSLGILGALRRLNLRDPRAPALAGETRLMLEEHFKDDVALLAELLGRDLSAWTRP